MWSKRCVVPVCVKEFVDFDFTKSHVVLSIRALKLVTSIYPTMEPLELSERYVW
jgi:hypothetical protein